MSGHGANSIFINKKINIGRPEHSLIPSDNISFLPYPPFPLKVDVICVSPRTRKHEDVLVVGDLDIDNLDQKNYLSDLCYIFWLLGFFAPILEVICVKLLGSSTIDVMLTNWPR